MSTIATVMRTGSSAIRVAMSAFALVMLILCGQQRSAADQTTIAELNRQVAVTLRSVLDNPRRQSIANVSPIGADRVDFAGAAGPLGSHFTLPSWAAPFARANRLLSIHSGGFDFDGWNALMPRGVVRLKYTIRL